MRIFVVVCLVLVTMTGCSIYNSLDNLVDPKDNPNNVGFLGEYDLDRLNDAENAIEIDDLRNKRTLAVSAVMNALQKQMKVESEKIPKKQQFRDVYKEIQVAIKSVKEYQASAIMYNSKLKVNTDKAIQCLLKAEEYQKQNKNDFTESKLKLAFLYLINDPVALWQYQTIDNNIFPDYLKWGETAPGKKVTSESNPFVFWGRTSFQNRGSIVEKPDSLVFSGGGAKGIAYVGVLKYLQEKDKLKNVKRFIGTSAGSIICMFISVAEYYEKTRKPDSKHFGELVYEIIEKEKFIDFIENPILNQAVKGNNLSPFTNNMVTSISPVADSLHDQYALCDGTNSLNFFKRSLVKFGFNGDITLSELYKKTGKHLILVSCSLSYRKIAYFDYKTAPDLSVAKAMRASMAIPFVFKPVKYNNDFFIDGGVVNNYPINYFDYKSLENGKEPATLGFVLYSEKNMLRPEWKKIADTADYTKAVLNIITTNTGSALFKKNVDRTVFIDCGKIDTMSFNMTIEQKKQLMQAGYDAIDKYYSEKGNKDSKIN